jgi:hypothetical protein
LVLSFIAGISYDPDQASLTPCPSKAVIAGLVVGAFIFSLLAVFVGIYFIKRILERDRSMGEGTESEGE